MFSLFFKLYFLGFGKDSGGWRTGEGGGQGNTGQSHRFYNIRQVFSDILGK